jgi:hypothetical protein
MTARDIAAMFRVAHREPERTLEGRIARLERRIAYAEEQIDEAHVRLCEAEAALDAARLAA